MITRLDLWDDTGYTESGVERPPIGSVLPSPDHTFYDLKPDKDSLFSSVSLKYAYTDLMGTSYLRAEYDTNNGSSIVVYGWVDAVSLRSDTSDFPMTDIAWHPDLWRTFGASAEYRTGTVRRRPAIGEMPPQPYPVRYRRAGTRTQLLHRGRKWGVTDVALWWVYLNVVEEQSGGNITLMRTICFPGWSDGTAAYITNYLGMDHQSVEFRHVFNGTLDERLELDPQSIIAVCVSPIPPFEYTGNGWQEVSPICPTVGGQEASWVLDKVGKDHVYLLARNTQNDNNYVEFTGRLSEPVRTTDTREYLVTNLDGSAIGSLPWGIEVQDYTYRMVNDISSFYLQLRFNGGDSYPEGLCFTASLPLVSMTGNSWSSYVYSGQREYDMQMRNLQSDQQMFQGLMGAVQGTGGQVGQGMAISALNKAAGIEEKGLGVGGMKGLGVAGSVLGIYTAAQLIGASGNYLANKFWFNGEYQKWSDYRAARQTDNLLTTGSGPDNIYYGTDITLLAMDNDDYSVEQRNNDISLYGCHVDEPMTSCQSLVEAGGPLQITNLTVGGDIPVQAKEYIREMFSNGVRLV